MLNNLKHKFVNWGLSHVLKAPMIEDVFGDLTPEDREKHSAGAKELLEHDTFKLLSKTMDQIAINKLAREATTNVEMLFGKALLHYGLTMKTKLKEFSAYKKPEQGETKKW